LKAPKIALLSGKESVPLNLEPFGLDEVIGYPVSIVETGILIVWNSLSNTLF
jgi:hypothetical protein